MKKTIATLILFLFAFSVVRTMSVKVQAEDSNLITNPSVEIIGNGSQPYGWHSDKWGVSNAVFEYRNDGQSGSRSISTKVTGYVRGDAKWYFDHVIVEPNTKYIYSDWYKSSIATEVDTEFVYQNDSVAYKWLGEIPASSVWKNSSFTFTTPSNIRSVAIFHSIAGNGNLQTDNFSLTKVGGSTVVDGVPNASLEQNSGGQPNDWETDTWLLNNATFSYQNDGHTGSHSVKVEITNYTNGDSKWYYTPQSVKSNTYYKFSDYYKSSRDTGIVAVVEKTDGSTDYIDIGNAPVSSNWNNFTAFFTTPNLAKTVTIFHTIAGVGYLLTDDYSLREENAGNQSFNRGLISLTFDDGWSSIYSAGFPLTKKYDYYGTLYLVSNYLNTSNHMTASEIRAMQSAGFEVGSHTVSHPHLPLLTSSQVNAELSQSKSTLQNQFGPVATFASPFGEYNSAVINQINQHYSSHRTTDSGMNTKNDFNKMAIKAETIKSDTSAAQINEWIYEAKVNKVWLVLTFHQIDNSGGLYATSPARFDSILGSIKNQAVPVVTVDQALSELLPQL